MKSYILKTFIIFILLINFSWAIVPCGDHELEKSELNYVWNELTSIMVRSRFADLDGIICVGKKISEKYISKFTYRDDRNNTLIKKSLEELSAFTVLVSQENLPSSIRSLVRKGPLVTVKIGKVVDDTQFDVRRYPLSVRFFRYLSPNAESDVREVQLEGTQYSNEEFPVVRVETKNVELLRLYVGAIPLKIENISLREANQNILKKWFSGELDKVDDLFGHI